MGLTDQDTPLRTDRAGSAAPSGDRNARPLVSRVNWLFSGVLLGAGTWLVVLAVIFAATGEWVVVAALLGGAVMCGLGMWQADRRLRAYPESDPG